MNIFLVKFSIFGTEKKSLFIAWASFRNDFSFPAKRRRNNDAAKQGGLNEDRKFRYNAILHYYQIYLCN